MKAIFNYQDLFLPVNEYESGNTPNFNNFTESEKSDYDYKVTEAVVIQDFNKTQWKDFSSKLRQNTLRNMGFCGHEWDCCGCLCGQSMQYEYIKKGVFKVIFTQSFNY